MRITIVLIKYNFNKKDKNNNTRMARTYLYPKNAFLDILVVFRLHFGQISFNLVQKAFATQQFALPATSVPFYDIWATMGDKSS